jgi:hypothetical protein
MRAKGNPEMTVTIYRAVPNDAKITEIKDGDWVTPTKGYAKIHGESNLNDDYKIISAEVKAKDIYTSGDSWHEWGYSKSSSVEKHQEHDQSSHGNWAKGITDKVQRLAPDIREEMSSYFGKDIDSYRNSEGYKDVKSRDEKRKADKQAYENHVLEIVAEKQGFADTPKIVTPEEMQQLEKDGWTVAYRGIQDFSYGGDESVTRTSKELAEEFRTGNYHAGSGVDGDGIYLTTDYEVARSYADDWRTGKQGTVIKVAIPPNSTMDEKEFHDFITTHRKIERGEIRYSEKFKFWGAEDIGVSAASEGHRGALHLRNMRVIKNNGRTDFNRIAPVYVIWDRSMLAVEEAGK